MKLVAFSDIHGNSYALEAFSKKIRTVPFDLLVFCGDIFGYYYNQEDVIKRLASMKPLVWLKGNHDENFLDIYYGKSSEELYISKYGHSYSNLKKRFSQNEADLLASHKSYAVLEIMGKRVGVFHGTPEDSLNGRMYPDDMGAAGKNYQEYDIVILGHTHCQMLRRIDGTLVINPGSLGQPRDGKGYSFAVIDLLSQNVAFHTVEVEQSILYQQISYFDPGLKKLRDVLGRERRG